MSVAKLKGRSRLWIGWSAPILIRVEDRLAFYVRVSLSTAMFLSHVRYCIVVMGTSMADMHTYLPRDSSYIDVTAIMYASSSAP